MRGVVSSGMAAALEERRLLACFDSIHGSSAGACAGAYFAAGQVRIGTSVYYEDINNRQFIDTRRFFWGQPVMNTHFLVDYVMRYVKPLDVEKIISNPGFLNIVATDVDKAEQRIYHSFRDADYFFDVLRGTITIPVIAGDPVIVDDRRLVDGGMVQQIALQSALEVGATHVLVLMTRRDGELERPDRGNKISLTGTVLQMKFGRSLSRLYKGRNSKINAVLRQISEQVEDCSIKIDRVVRPHNSSDVGRLDTDTEILKLADKEARQAVFSYLDQ